MKSSNHAEKHVIFGTGPLGQSVMRALLKRGKAPLMVNRSGERNAGIPTDVELVGGDSENQDFTRQVTQSAAVVYQCASPPYHEWPEKFPPLQAAILAAAESNNAILVSGENTYLYGDTDGKPLSEDLPYNAYTRKGIVRAQLTEELFEAHRLGKVRATAARASDFFGAAALVSAVGERVFIPALQGKTAQFTGNLDLPHTMTYIDDFGEGMVVLAENEQALGQAWHIPNDQPQITQRQFGELIFKSLEKEPKLSATSTLMMRIAGLFMPQAREMVEMMYEFEKPFVVDSSKFVRAFGDISTPLADSIPETVAWYRAYLNEAD